MLGYFTKYLPQSCNCSAAASSIPTPLCSNTVVLQHRWFRTLLFSNPDTALFVAVFLHLCVPTLTPLCISNRLPPCNIGGYFYMYVFRDLFGIAALLPPCNICRYLCSYRGLVLTSTSLDPTLYVSINGVCTYVDTPCVLLVLLKLLNALDCL